MTVDDVYEQFAREFAGRKFSAGLLIAFIDFFLYLEVPNLKARDFNDVIARFHRQSTTAAGAHANTLIVKLPNGRTLSLRPFYNQIERFFRAEQKRFDYPSCAPHATQAWGDYVQWLDALSAFSFDELNELRQRVVTYVLTNLESQEFNAADVKLEPPLFRLLLETFDMKAVRGEPSGAAFQGIVFGFLRADNPHLQIEIDKVRTGSKRLQRIGDIDAWDGERLAISAEIKHLRLTPDDVPDFEAFANQVGRRGAIGLVVALAFEEGSRELVSALGVKPLTIDDLLRFVELWDPVKQRIAVSSFIYYAKHVEKNAALAKRIELFIQQVTTTPVINPENL
jgi:hypothetical protein